MDRASAKVGSASLYYSGGGRSLLYSDATRATKASKVGGLHPNMGTPAPGLAAGDSRPRWGCISAR